MKMTRKQSVDWVKDNAKWEIIPGNNFVRCSTMEFGGRRFIRIEELSCSNVLEARYLHKAEPALAFRGCGYRYIDDEGGLSSTSETEMANWIYEKAKEMD